MITKRWPALRESLVGLAMVACLGGLAHATTTVHTGSYVFPPGPGNIITITGTSDSGDTMQGMNFVFGIGDEQSAGQPLITAVDIVGPGTVFFGNNTGQVFPTFGPPGFVVVGGTTTTSGTVPTDGILGYVTVDMTGVSPGVYQLQLKKIFGFPQNTFNLAPTAVVFDLGVITYIPEPASVVLALFALGSICLIALGRHRVRKARPAAS